MSLSKHDAFPSRRRSSISPYNFSACLNEDSTYSSMIKPEYHPRQYHHIPHTATGTSMNDFQDELKVLNTDLPQNINGFFISMTGLDPDWTFRDIQVMLQGIFAPECNIRRDTGNGQAFVKLMNKKDFDTILQHTDYIFNNHRIVIRECPTSTAHKYFQSSSCGENEYYIPKKRDLCYFLKGLPYFCTFDDLFKFFHGFEIADIFIFYRHDGRAQGSGYISFTNWRDFDGARAQNEKKIGPNYIELQPSTDKNMSDAEKTYYVDGSFVCYSKLSSGKKRDLYVSRPSQVSSTSDEPKKKVPYLWEPPDEEQEEKKRSHSLKHWGRKDIDYRYRDRKSSANRINNRKSKSPERRGRRFNNAKNYYKDEKYLKLKGEDNPRNLINLKINPRDYMRKNKEDLRRNKEDRSETCMVHITDVDVSIDAEALKSFLRGFEFYEDTIIRHFTSKREPTPNIRVTFHNKKEAKRAIQFLNGKFLGEHKVSMYLV